MWNRKPKTVTDSRGVTYGENGAVIVKERPLLPAIETGTMTAAQIAEYRVMSEEIGVEVHALAVEEFRSFLANNDMPTFNLQEVIAYMDNLTRRDNPSALGWEWLPVRERDKVDAVWGRASRVVFGSGSGISEGMAEYLSRNDPVLAGGKRVSAASNYHGGMRAKVYSRTIPLQALRKIAKIEREFGTKTATEFSPSRVAFMVTDYVNEPHIVERMPTPRPRVERPDPFLMAVVPNPGVENGVGHFVIDVWDEPGFGIEQMLK